MQESLAGGLSFQPSAAAPLAEPSAGLTPRLYLQVKQHLLEHDPDAQQILEWSQRELAPPVDADKLAAEVIWIILCAGRSAQAARTIETRVWKALRAGTPVVGAFGYRAKAEAIERAWAQRHQDFEHLQQALPRGPEAVIEWAGALPFVGPITKYQLAKNFGVQTVKADLHLCRLAGIHHTERLPPGERYRRCQTMAEEIARATGDSVPVVDSITWLACNKGVLEVKFGPHRVVFHQDAPVRGAKHLLTVRRPEDTMHSWKQTSPLAPPMCSSRRDGATWPPGRAVLDDYRDGVLTKEQAVGGLAHVMAALNIGNVDEARAWFREGRKLIRDAA